MKKRAPFDPHEIIDGDPAVWIHPPNVRSFYANLVFARGARSARVAWAVDQFRRSFTPALKRTDVVAFVPCQYFKSLKRSLIRREQAEPGFARGITLGQARELTRNVVVFTLADIELGSTPAPPKYVLYTTEPTKRVRHHIVIRRFDGRMQ